MTIQSYGWKSISCIVQNVHIYTKRCTYSKTYIMNVKICKVYESGMI